MMPGGVRIRQAKGGNRTLRVQLTLKALSFPLRNEVRAPLTRSGVFEIVLVVFSGFLGLPGAIWGFLGLAGASSGGWLGSLGAPGAS